MVRSVEVVAAGLVPEDVDQEPRGLGTQDRRAGLADRPIDEPSIAEGGGRAALGKAVVVQVFEPGDNPIEQLVREVVGAPTAFVRRKPVAAARVGIPRTVTVT